MCDEKFETIDLCANKNRGKNIPDGYCSLSKGHKLAFSAARSVEIVDNAFVACELVRSSMTGELYLRLVRALTPTAAVIRVRSRMCTIQCRILSQHIREYLGVGDGDVIRFAISENLSKDSSVMTFRIRRK